MRPVSDPQSALRYPLSAIFSTEAAVRIVRELALSGNACSTGYLAGRAKVSIHTVRRTLERLVELGVVASVGLGPYPTYRLSRDHPLAPAIVALFEAEAKRIESVFSGIREIARSMVPRPEAVWVFGSVARHEDEASSDLDIAVVFEEEQLVSAVALMREALARIEAEQVVAISVVGVSARDVLRLSAGDPWWRGLEADGWPLDGPDPKSYASNVRSRAQGAAKKRVAR